MGNDHLSITEDNKEEILSYKSEGIEEPDAYDQINFLKGIDWYTEELALELQLMCKEEEKNKEVDFWQEVESYRQIEELLRKELEELELKNKK